MSILIKGMEMPKSCKKCLFFVENKHDRGEDSFCRLLSKEVYPFMGTLPDDCPLVPVPEPHGDLVDVEELMEKIACIVPYFIKTGYEKVFTDGLSSAYEIVKAAPTIISAEEVYGQYTDTAGNFHWCGTYSGEHTIKAEEGET